MPKCKECELKDMRISLLKDQVKMETESADRWRRDYMMLLRSTTDLVDYADHVVVPPAETPGVG